MEEDNKISITVCGDGGCGKSSLTLRLVRSQWTHEYDPTIEDSYSITRTLDGEPYLLNLTDTAGQEEYRHITASSAARYPDAFLLVYDITSARSLAALDHFAALIDAETAARLARGGVPPVRIVAGNKCDLAAGKRQVSAAAGLEWARKRGCGFMETSARDMVNVEETFALLVRRVVEARRVHSSNSAAHVSPSAALFSNLPHAVAPTKPLTPLNDEKAESFDDDGFEDRRARRGGGGFWKSLRCW